MSLERKYGVFFTEKEGTDTQKNIHCNFYVGQTKQKQTLKPIATGSNTHMIWANVLNVLEFHFPPESNKMMLSS